MYAGRSELGKKSQEGSSHQAGGEASAEVHRKPAAKAAVTVGGRGETCVLGTPAACCKAASGGEASCC